MMRSRSCRILPFFLFLTAMCACLIITPSVCKAESQKWQGVDESVVEKYAKEHGRPSREPLINTDKGDLLLFVFIVAGAVGGFVGGYFWRMLVEQKGKTDKKEIKT